MKRSSWVLLVLLTAGLFGFSKVSSAKISARPIEEPQIMNPSDQSSDDYERTKELLEIWKDHVRTVTKERDEAYKEIETLKNQGASAPPAVQEAASSSDKEDSARQIEFLNDKMSLLQRKYEELQSENQKLRDSASQDQQNQVNEAQLAGLKAKAEKLKVVEKEYQEARNYFDSYLKELDTKNKKLTDENESLKSQIQNSAEAGKKNQEAFEQELSQLKADNEELQKTQAQQSKTILTLKSTIKSSLDSLDPSCSDKQK